MQTHLICRVILGFVNLLNNGVMLPSYEITNSQNFLITLSLIYLVKGLTVLSVVASLTVIDHNCPQFLSWFLGSLPSFCILDFAYTHIPSHDRQEILTLCDEFNVCSSSYYQFCVFRGLSFLLMRLSLTRLLVQILSSEPF